MEERKFLTYGIDKISKSLMHISDVKSGLDCGCICPSCSGTLIAKKGDCRVYRFSHYNCSECSGGAETALHLAAKKIILESKEFTLPSLSLGDGLFIELKVNFDDNLVDYNLHNLYLDLNSKNISGPINIVIDNVESEKRLCLDDSTYIIPDLIITSHNRQLIIEIAVTHKADLEKRRKLETAGISAIEINLSETDYDITPEELKSIILGDSCKSWLFNKKAYDKFQYYYSNSTQINYRFKRGDPISKNRCKRDGQISKSCSDCSSKLMYDGKIEWCCFPMKIE